MSPKVNAAWHEKNPMPKGATMEMRIKWHLEHQTKCGCNEIPKSVRMHLKKRGMAAVSTKGRNPQKSRKSRKPKAT
jgi:hypothetical protein